MCKPGYCNNGQETCIPGPDVPFLGFCQKNTGGTCNLDPCDKSRGEVECKSFGPVSKLCVCKTGFCSDDNGRCVLSSIADSEVNGPGYCEHNTGGTCGVSSCAASHGDTVCQRGQCLCSPGYCNDGHGRCVQMNQAQFDFHERGKQLAHVQQMQLPDLQERAEKDGLQKIDIDAALSSDHPRRSLAKLVISYELHHGSPVEDFNLAADNGERSNSLAQVAPWPFWVTVPALAVFAGVTIVSFAVFMSGRHVRYSSRREPLLASGTQ